MREVRSCRLLPVSLDASANLFAGLLARPLKPFAIHCRLYSTLDPSDLCRATSSLYAAGFHDRILFEISSKRYLRSSKKRKKEERKKEYRSISADACEIK